jgi:8-oxo-dGTP pyrophosphatase MutT (NUDIX family)
VVVTNTVVVLALRSGAHATLGPVPLPDGEDPLGVATTLCAGAGLPGSPHLLGVASDGAGLEVVFGALEGRIAPWTPPPGFVDEHPHARLFVSWLEVLWEEHQLRNWGMTADVFVVDDGEFLLLKRTGASAGLWYIPGGIVEAGEDPADGALREVAEETGLLLASVDLLLVWSYEVSPGRFAYHATFIGAAPGRDVVISDEHTAHRWVTPERYLASDLTTWRGIDHPVLRSFAPQVVHNVELVRRRMAETG